MPPMPPADRRELAALLRRLLDTVEAGKYDPLTPQELALLRQLHGAQAALDAVDRPRRRG